MNETARCVLVRHGETTWSRDGRHTGRSDIPLTPAGEAQARGLRARLQSWRFAAVFVSPLRRARQTCDLAGYLDAAVVDDAMQEWDYGTYEGRTSEEIRAERPNWSIWKDGVVDGESVADVGRRADSVIARLRRVDGDVALFAHGHFLRILGARWCGLDPVEAEHLALSAAAISVVGTDRGSPTIWTWNDAGDPEHG